MLAPWSRIPEDFILEEYLERYGDFLEAHPATYAGSWADACRMLGGAGTPGAYRQVHLDLGCGKGDFTVTSALREPDVLFIGTDTDPIAVACAARSAAESGARNIVFVPGRDGALPDVFAPGELSTIYLNFPTPHPKGREAGLRLTCQERLAEYRTLLAEGATLAVRTDNLPFFSYTLAQLERAGYMVLEKTGDAQAEHPDIPQTAYERKAVASGGRISAVRAMPGAEPSHIGDKPSDSLYDYLPDDLDSMTYVPPEMARAIRAIRRTKTPGYEGV